MPMNQINKKLKLIIEAPKYIIYSNTLSYAKVIWAKSVNSVETLVIPHAEYTFNTMSRNQHNQKLKLIVEAP